MAQKKNNNAPLIGVISALGLASIATTALIVKIKKDVSLTRKEINIISPQKDNKVCIQYGKSKVGVKINSIRILASTEKHNSKLFFTAFRNIENIETKWEDDNNLIITFYGNGKKQTVNVNFEQGVSKIEFGE